MVRQSFKLVRMVSVLQGEQGVSKWERGQRRYRCLMFALYIDAAHRVCRSQHFFAEWGNGLLQDSLTSCQTLGLQLLSLAQLSPPKNSHSGRLALVLFLTPSLSTLIFSFCPELQQCQHSCPCGPVSRPSPLSLGREPCVSMRRWNVSLWKALRESNKMERKYEAPREWNESTLS